MQRMLGNHVRRNGRTAAARKALQRRRSCQPADEPGRGNDRPLAQFPHVQTILANRSIDCGDSHNRLFVGVLEKMARRVFRRPGRQLLPQHGCFRQIAARFLRRHSSRQLSPQHARPFGGVVDLLTKPLYASADGQLAARMSSRSPTATTFEMRLSRLMPSCSHQRHASRSTSQLEPVANPHVVGEVRRAQVSCSSTSSARGVAGDPCLTPSAFVKRWTARRTLPTRPFRVREYHKAARCTKMDSPRKLAPQTSGRCLFTLRAYPKGLPVISTGYAAVR
jgi:hypothetical protein